MSDPEKGIWRKIVSAVTFVAPRREAAPAGPPDVPWSEPVLPLRRSVVALVTTGGVHLRSQTPFDIDDPEGDAGFREIPVETQRELLTFTRDYYDHTDAEADLNLVLPIQRMQEMQRAGALGALHPVAYSLMGQIRGARLEELKVNAARIAASLAAAGANYALLVPA